MTLMTFVLVHEIKSGETSGVKTFVVGNGHVWNISHVELKGLIASTQAHAKESSKKSVTLSILMNKYSKEENTWAKVNTNMIQPRSLHRLDELVEDLVDRSQVRDLSEYEMALLGDVGELFQL